MINITLLIRLCIIIKFDQEKNNIKCTLWGFLVKIIGINLNTILYNILNILTTNITFE